MPFIDRKDAGRRLGALLRPLTPEYPVVLGLPRGGIPVAAEVARTLGAPLDVLVVRKLGVPWQPELGLGAIGEDGVVVVNDEVVAATGVTRADIEAVERVERAELERRVHTYRNGRAAFPLDERTAIIVDDGIATGSTVRAAIDVVRARGARRVIVATPVAPARTVTSLRAIADAVEVVESPEEFHAIGQFYADFEQTTDEEVIAALSATH